MPKKTRLLDKDEIPFTVQEIVLAASLVWPPRVATKYADVIAQQVHAYVRYRTQRRDLSRRHLYPIREPMFGLDLEDEVLAALHVISPAAQARVTWLMKRRWRHRRRLLIERERVRAARRTGLLPTHRQMAAMVRKAKLHQASGSRVDRFRALMIETPHSQKRPRA